MVDPSLTQLLEDNARRLLRNDIPTPLYHQIFVLLQERILSGELGQGTRLPTELELADAFGVSRITVKRALDELAAEKLVQRHRGKGTHVIYRPPTRPVRSPLKGLLESLHILAEHTQVRVLQFHQAVPPAPVQSLFATRQGEPLAHSVRLRLRGKVPFGYYNSWTRTTHPDFNADNLATLSRLALFERIGIRISRVEQTLSAVNADAVAAMHLDVTPGTALLSLERRSFNAEGELVDLLGILYRPDQFTYEMTLDVEDLRNGG